MGMKKDVSSEHLTQLFKTITEKSTGPNAVKLHGADGKPLFTPEEVCRTTDPLTLMTRYGMVDRGITEEVWRDTYRIQARRANEDPAKIPNVVSNGCAAMKKDGLTWKAFKTAFAAIGYDISDMTVSLSNRDTGEQYDLKLSDARAFCQRLNAEKERKTIGVLNIVADDNDTNV